MCSCPTPWLTLGAPQGGHYIEGQVGKCRPNGAAKENLTLDTFLLLLLLGPQVTVLPWTLHLRTTSRADVAWPLQEDQEDGTALWGLLLYQTAAHMPAQPKEKATLGRSLRVEVNKPPATLPLSLPSVHLAPIEPGTQQNRGEKESRLSKTRESLQERNKG